MNKILKSALGVTAFALVSAATVLPTAVYAWGDNSGLSAGRASYTLSQINSNVLGDKIVLNSISDSPFGNEKDFVAAREASSKTWEADEITVENGKEYIISLYVHNNNPKGTAAVAKDVTTTINLPSTSAKTVQVDGIVSSSNAAPTKYWDDIVFKSANGSNFHLEYVSGSALLENNGIGKNGGVKLSNDIFTKGVKIGYDALDGNVPGCYQYANYVSVRVKAVYDNTTDYTVAKTVRKSGDKDWVESVDAKVGEEVEFQIVYKNTSTATQNGVVVKDVLPTNLKYVAGSTKLYNAKYTSGLTAEDKLTTTGLQIGSYTAGSNAIIRFKAQVVDTSMNCGSNTMNNWAQVTVGDKVVQDKAAVVTAKTCPTPTPEPEPTPTPTPEPTPSELPTTGISGVVAGALGAGALTTALGYFFASQKRF